MNLKKYIAELKRRNVFKSGITYLIVAWLIAQIASIVLPAFEAPPYYMKILLFILSIGFPFNLVFSWIYDITPEGIKKTDRIEQESEKSVLKNSRLNKVIIASLSITVLVLLYNQINNNLENNKVNPAVISENVSGNNLLAVLPFLNTKSDVTTDYLGFAIADQIIGSLVYLNNITVRPSSSVRKFQNQTIDPTVVGEDLNVDYILVGNYLKEENIIRLNIELINLKNNQIIWREAVEVSFQSAFELQDIVSKKVVTGLNVQFSQNEIDRINKDIPVNSLAYEYYLRAIAYPRSNEGDKLAVEMIKKSIELDSLYAPAYALYGDRLHTLANYGLLNPEETRKAEIYLKKGLSINPELFAAMGSLVFIYTETDRIEEAVKLTRKMVELSPNNADAHFSLSYIYRYAGMNEEAVLETEKVLILDGKNPRYRSSLITFTFAGQIEKALSTYDNFKESPFIIQQKGWALFRMSKQQESIKYFKRAFELDPEGLGGHLSKAMIAAIEGDKNDARILMKKLESYKLKDAEPWYFFAMIYGLLGDRAACNRCLRRAVEGGFFNYPLMSQDVFFKAVNDDSEFQEIIELAKNKHLAFKRELF